MDEEAFRGVAGTSIMTDGTVSPTRAGVSIALLACAVMVYEIAITRILSVVVWYHWAFLCISLAMLGLGAPGVWFSLSKRPSRFLPALTLASALLVPLSIVLIFKLGNRFQSLAIVFSMMCLLLPLLSLGGAICLLLMQAPGRSIGRMYGFDLAGACLGALLIIPLLHLAPTPLLVAGIGLLPLAAYVLLAGRLDKWALMIGLVLLAALAWREPFALRYTKTYEETKHLRPIYEKWTPTARLTVFDSIFWVYRGEMGFAWGRGSRANLVPVTQYWIEQDGSAGTPLTQFNGKLESYRYLLDDVTTVGYELRPPQSVAIIGAGGGRDIITSRLVGAKQVDAVELNGHLVDLVSRRFGSFSGDVYHLPGVTAVVSEGRSFLTRAARNYDMIQVSLIDSWAATAAGAFALSENNLYTVEAFQLYFRRLSSRGLLSMSRWLTGVGLVEVPRLTLLVDAALRREGVSRPGQHVAVVRGAGVGTVLVSRAPFSSAELSALNGICERRGFLPLFPRLPLTPPLSVIADLMTHGAQAFPVKGVRLDPPTDDKPFFFQVFSPFLPMERAVRVAEHRLNADSLRVLQILMLVMGAVTLALFFVPFPLYRWFTRYPGYWRGSLFFCCIGIAFMLVEIPWLQRFILYLGHPSYATTVVLAALLFGAAMGASSSARIGLRNVQRLGLLLPALVLLLDLLLAALFAGTLGYSLWLRVVITLAALSPVAFLMGLFFPLGMVRFGDGNKPWYWAMNGAAGVLASVVSLALSMELGFTSVAAIGAVFYLVAWLLMQGRPAESL